LSALIGMTDGSYDGDALFFSRDIHVDGDMEAVVALRNAIDDSRVDFLSESVIWLGPLAAPIERILRSLVGAPSVHQEMGVGGGG
jgi:predicted lipid carrier protein YhbT